MGFEDKGFVCLAVCCCLLFTTSVILFAVSFGTLDVDEMGIQYNKNFLTIDEEHGAYSNGRYFLGLGSTFIRYPSTLVVAEFVGKNALSAWSEEGQEVFLEVGFYYRLDRSKLVEIYKRFNDQYHNRMLQIAKRVLKQVTIQFQAIQFFSNRTMIGERMSRDLRVSLADENMILELFALRAVDIPDAFEDKVQSKVVTLQAAKTASYRKDTAIARAANLVQEGNGYAVINRTLAEANARALLTVETARAEGIKLLASAEANAYQRLSSVLGLSARPFLKYRWAQLLSSLEASSNADRHATVTLGFDSVNLKL
jgi:regulator of protease activity HflC (stomatin/prohibitin superfamily)